MPKGVPAPIVGIGKAGLINAAIVAAQTLAISDDSLKIRLQNWLKENNKESQIDVETSDSYRTKEN